MSFLSPDILIIGAGPAGTTAAALLNQQGFEVAILEKSHFPRFMIGESLLPQCMDILDQAHLLEAVQAQNFQRKNGAIIFRNHQKEILDFSQKFSEGWDYTYQVQRADFDQKLAQTVEAAGVKIHYGHEVTGFENSQDSCEVSVRNDFGENLKFKPRFVLDASGMGRVLAQILNLQKDTGMPPIEALFCHLKDVDRNTPQAQTIDFEKIWICIHPQRQDTWYWTIAFSDGTASVGVVGPKDFFDNFSGKPEIQLKQMIFHEPHLKKRFKNFLVLRQPLAMKGFAVASQKMIGPHYAILGHAVEFLDPIFSSGIAISLKSASLAARILGRQLNGQAVDWQLQYVKPLEVGLKTFQTFIQKWYEGSFQRVIFDPQKTPAIKKKITSILAGYAWDETNPFVSQPEKRLNALIELTQKKV